MSILLAIVYARTSTYHHCDPRLPLHMIAGQPSVTPSYIGKALPVWMKDIHDGKIRLPLFQRSYVWPAKNAVSLVETVLMNRTMGTLLVLENDKHFPSINLSGAPEFSDSSCDVRLILDGQQRLTALWQAFGGHGGSQREAVVPLPVFVHVEKWLDDSADDGIRLTLTTEKKGNVKLSDYECFMENPEMAYQARCFPVSILANEGIPAHNSPSLRKWCISVHPEHSLRSRTLESQIESTFGARLRKYAIWYHPLPLDTDMETAIKVFILTNNTSMQVSMFDIAVAYHDKGNYREDMEIEQGLRFRISDYLDHEQQSGKEVMLNASNLSTKQRMIPRYGDHLLKLACVVSDIMPSNANFVRDTTVANVIEDFDSLTLGLSWSANFIRTNGFPLYKYLPSLIPLRVLPAIYLVAVERGVSESPKYLALCRAFFWRSLLTSRYERDANRRLLYDFRHIRDMIRDNAIVIAGEDNVFDSIAYPFLNFEKLTNSDISDSSARKIICGIAALSGKDFATLEPISAADNDRWDYHHLFPKKYLQTNSVPKKYIDHCLNFTLLRKDTNSRIIGKLPPHVYLSKPTKLTEGVSLDDVREAVPTHLIPLSELMADPKDIGVLQTYTNFIRARAKIIDNKIKSLCHGA